MHAFRLFWLALVLLGLVACDRSGPSAGSTAATPKAAVSFKGVDITGAEYARQFTLTDQLGAQRSLAEFKGKVVAVFFGYTHCPDVCPTTMAELAAVKRALGADGARLQAVFVTVDPDRDTAAVLKPYMENFDPSFVALRGTAEQTTAVAKEFKVFYAKVPGQTADNYSVDHTAGTYIFDPEGRVRLFSRNGSGVDALKYDIQALLAGA